MQKTFEELGKLDAIVGRMYQKNPELRNSKMGYAYKRFVAKNFQPTYDAFISELSDVRIDNALTNEATKEILTDPNPNSRGFKYSKEGLKAVIKAEDVITKKFNAKQIEIEPYIVKPENLPELTDEQKEALTGLLI